MAHSPAEDRNASESVGTSDESRDADDGRTSGKKLLDEPVQDTGGGTGTKPTVVPGGSDT